MGKNTAEFLRKCRKGVISSWFFGIFLICFTFILSAMENDTRMLKAMVNLKTAEAYLEAETEVIHEIRCLLEQENAENAMYHTASYAFLLSVDGNLLTAEILDPPEILTIQLEEGRIISFSTERQDVFTEE